MSDSKQTIGNYKIIAELKRGAQGLVYVVEDVRTQERCCLKSMNIPESCKMDFDKTMLILKLVGESNEKDVFVKYKEHFFEGKNAILVMEYCSGGDLQTLIEKRRLQGKRFSEAEITELLIDGATALQKLLALNMIHRDVKAANFLIGDDGKFKICDLNTSKLLEGTEGASTIIGTVEYSAPEVISCEKYSYPADVWSLGVVAYQMMVGRTPFVNERGINIVKLAQGIYDPVDSALGFSQPLVDLVSLCLSVDPSKRPIPAHVLASPVVAKTQEAAMQERKLREIVATEVSVAVGRCEERMRKEFEEKLESFRKEMSERFEKKRNARILHACNKAGVTMACLHELCGVTVNTILMEAFARAAGELHTFDLLVVGGADRCGDALDHLKPFEAQIDAFRNRGGAVLMLHDSSCMYSAGRDTDLAEFLPSVNADLGWTRTASQPFYETEIVKLEGFAPVFASPNRIPPTFTVHKTHGDLNGNSQRHTLIKDSHGRPFLMANWGRRVAKVETGHSNQALADELRVIVNVVHHLLLSAGK